jgi:hypothetical protein
MTLTRHASISKKRAAAAAEEKPFKKKKRFLEYAPRAASSSLEPTRTIT